MQRAPLTTILAGVLLGTGLLAAAPGSAAVKKPATPKAVRAALSGTVLAVSWRATPPGRVEVRVKSSVGKRSTTKMRSAKASKGSLTVTVTGAKGAALSPSAIKVSLRRCTGRGRTKRCSRSSAWKKPSAGTLPGRPTAPDGGTPGSSTPGGNGTGGPKSTSPTPTPVGPTPEPGTVSSVGGCPMLPADHAFNQDVSAFPRDPRSDAYVASIGLTRRLHPDFGSADLGQGPGGFGIPYRVVPATQPFVRTTFSDYADESDYVAGEPGYPVPLDTAVEGGPDSDGDRHVLVVRQGECKLYEMGNAYPGASSWTASGGAIWDLATGARPVTAQPGWTSADAAGLPILPGLVRYDEVAAGEIRHAIRFTVSNTQEAYIAPASHWASDSSDPDRPPMGLRLRMRADVDLSRFSGQALIVATALKKYGMIVADNGSDWYLGGAADTRWDDDDLGQLKTIPGSAFEVVKTGAVVTP